MRDWEIHYAWVTLVSVLFLLVLVGCAGTAPNTTTAPNTRTYLSYSVGATERGDWVAAYRLMEDALVAEDPTLRQEAKNLVDKYPQIRDAAFESFSRESLESTYQEHGEQAWKIEEERLSIYEATLATPEKAAQARHNYQEVYGDRILKSRAAKNIRLEAMEVKWSSDNEFEQEIQHALMSGSLVRVGSIRDLLKGMIVDQTLRKEALARFGRPSRTFESNTILTWAVRVEDNKYSILARLFRDKGGVTHSLVMAFDETLVLSEVAMVRIVK